MKAIWAEIYDRLTDYKSYLVYDPYTFQENPLMRSFFANRNKGGIKSLVYRSTTFSWRIELLLYSLHTRCITFYTFSTRERERDVYQYKMLNISQGQYNLWDSISLVLCIPLKKPLKSGSHLHITRWRWCADALATIYYMQTSNIDTYLTVCGLYRGVYVHL